MFACGPWLWKIFPEFLRTRLRTPMGNVFYYGTPVGDNRFVAPYLPSFNFPGITGWPALPNDARGFRVRVGGGTQTDPDTSQRWIDPSNFTRPRQFLIDRFPLLIDAPLLETRSCHYELSVTRNFYIDTHPEWSNVWIAGGGSAEGFKFGPMVGDYTAKRVMGIEGDPAIAKGFRIPKEEFEEPPRTAADSARVKARADSVAQGHEPIQRRPIRRRASFPVRARRRNETRRAPRSHRSGSDVMRVVAAATARRVDSTTCLAARAPAPRPRALPSSPTSTRICPRSTPRWRRSTGSARMPSIIRVTRLASARFPRSVSTDCCSRPSTHLLMGNHDAWFAFGLA